MTQNQAGDPNQGFFMPGTMEEYEAAEAFKSYWKPDDGSVLEYVIINAGNIIRQGGQQAMELDIRATAPEHSKKEPRPISVPHDPKFLWMWKAINQATGVAPRPDANTGKPVLVPAWYIGKKFIATAKHRTAPNPTDPSKTVTYVDLRDFTASTPTGAPAGGPAPTPQAQPTPAAAPAPAPAAMPTPVMAPAPTVASGQPPLQPVRRVPGVPTPG